MEVSGQLNAPLALSPGKCSRYPLDMRLDGPQSRSGRASEEKKIHTLPLPELELRSPKLHLYSEEIRFNSSLGYHLLQSDIFHDFP
jgi:hypothetical protein